MQVSRPHSIAALRRKTHPTYPNRGVNENLLMENFCEWIDSQLIKVNQCTVVGHGDVPGSKSNNETRSVFDALSHGIGQESSFL